MAYVFDKNGYPINRNGKPRKTFCGFRVNKITATFKQSPNNEGAKVKWIHFKTKEAKWELLIVMMYLIVGMY